MSIAKFPKQLAVTEWTANRRRCFRDRLDIIGDPNKVTDLTEVTDGDAVAVYELKHVYTYCTDPRLDKD